MAARARAGAGAGALGAVLLTAFEQLERAALGRLPVYAAARVGERWTGSRGARAAALGLAARLAYGAALGVALAYARRALPRSTLLAGAAAGLAVASAESWLLPRVGAVPPRRLWSRAERVAIAAHAAAWGVASVCALGGATSARPVSAAQTRPRSTARA